MRRNEGTRVTRLGRIAALGLVALLAWVETRAGDCNRNGREDAEDIAEGRSPDCDGDGVPDECEVPAVSWPSAERYPVGSGASSILSVDLDGDGHLDLVVGNRGGSVSTLIGRGDGTFREGARIPTQKGTKRIVVADVTDDGLLDLAVGLEGHRFLAVLTAVGDGTYEEWWTREFPFDIEPIAIDDVDEDELPDLLLIAPEERALMVLPGERTGFGEPIVSTTTTRLELAVVADFSGDGRLDVFAAPDGSGETALLTGEGDGSFLQRLSPSVRGSLLTAGDVNGDGHTDVVCVETVLLGGGAGEFEPIEAPGLHGAATAALADFDADGRMDVALPLAYADVAWLFLGGGDGTFKPAIEYGAGDEPVAVAAGDFDGDSRMDLAVAAGRSGDVTILRGSTEGRAALLRAPRLLPSTTDVRFLLVGDVVEDGVPDILTASDRPTASLLPLLPDGGTGEFVHPLVGDRISHLALEDFDGDDHLDLLTWSSWTESIQLRPGAGDGTFGDGEFLSTADLYEWGAVGDFDGDGRLDVAASVPASDRIAFILDPGRSLREDAEVAVEPYAGTPAAADFDGDGIDDLVFWSEPTVRSSRLLRVPGSAALEFVPELLAEFEETTTLLRPADVDGDEIPDLLLVHGATMAVSVLLGRGDGTFVAADRLAVDPQPRDVAILDVDGDEIPDIVTAHPSSRTLVVSSGRGDGTFRPGQRIRADRAWWLDAHDMDGDGRLDLLVGDQTYGIQMLLARDTHEPALEADCDRNGVPDPCDIAAGAAEDIDGNGVLDGCESDVPTDEDCNGNGRSDALDIARGESEDCNGDGIPDECREVPAAIEFHAPRTTALVGPIESWAVGDFDGDGVADLATAREGAGVIRVRLGGGDGDFGPPADQRTAFRAWGLKAMDFDADGALDIVFGTLGAYGLLRGRGDGTFEDFERMEFGDSPWGRYVVRDLDGDGRLDFARTSNQYTGRVVVAGPDGTYEQMPDLPGIRRTRRIAAGDFDEDGKVDLALTIADRDEVGIYLGRGDGTFPTERFAPCVEDSVNLLAIDVDRDGHVDLVTGDEEHRGLVVSRGRGDGTFELPVGLGSGVGPDAILAADFDGDGVRDVISYLRRSDTAQRVSIHLARPGGGHRTVPAGGVPVPAELIAVADASANGLQDLFLGDYHGDRVSVLLRRNHEPTEVADCNRNGVPDDCDLAAGTSEDENENGVPDDCESGLQVPGDCDQNGALEITDAICILGVLFRGTPEGFPCGDGAADHPGNLALLAGGDAGRVGIAEAVYLLRFLFLGGPPLPLAVPGEERWGCVPIIGCPESEACGEEG